MRMTSGAARTSRAGRGLGIDVDAHLALVHDGALYGGRNLDRSSIGRLVRRAFFVAVVILAATRWIGRSRRDDHEGIRPSLISTRSDMMAAAERTRRRGMSAVMYRSTIAESRVA